MASLHLLARLVRRPQSRSRIGAHEHGNYEDSGVACRFREKKGRVMGGLGSGRPSGSGRSTVESCRSLDVNRLQRTGCLKPGWAGGWQWSQDGERVASISLRAEVDLLHVTYRFRSAGGDWEGRP